MPSLSSRGAGPTDRDLDREISGARPLSFWLDQPGPERLAALDSPTRAELVVVGGGFTGLWTALLAAERGLDVVLLEAERVAWAATGRNGGFCEASLTHGEANGRTRWPGEIDRLDALGRANLDSIGDWVRSSGTDCGFERTGSLTVATEGWQADQLRGNPGWMDAGAVRAEVDSPTYRGGVWDRDGCAVVDPARLAWGLRRACLGAGVRMFEGTAVTGLEGGGRRPVTVTATGGVQVRAGRVALATNAFRPLVRGVRRRIVPVYDHVLVTEPLSPAQLASVGWAHRQGVSDAGNRFHYYRLTPDQRVLWGGWDATYHFGRRVDAAHDQRMATFRTLARHFRATFPQLAEVRFTHRWGGAIDTCSRFCAFFGTAHGGRVAYAAGYTGLGVGASRFGARVVLELLHAAPIELDDLEMVRTRPLPFPPEPLAWPVIQATRWSLARADRRGGERNAWLRLLDRLGLGFDS